ncbi:MAG: VanW family protein [Chloroflexi bacterium]|nr:VanW family protein [Chloroflexota bacterium]
MRHIVVILLALIPLFVSIPPAHADTCALAPIFSEAPSGEVRAMAQHWCTNPARVYAPAPPGKIVGGGIIYLYAKDEAKNSSLNNVLHAINQLQGKYIYPGEIFSFNREANLLQQTIPYDLGPDVSNNLVKAGGVCMVSTLLATAAHDAGLPFINERGKPIKRPVPHSRFYKYYHQVNFINNRRVPIVEAAVAIQKDDLEKPWETIKDMQFINTTGRILVIHFEPSFTVNDLDLTQPFGLIQQEQTIKVSLHALPTGFDAWFSRLDSLDAN